MAIIFDPDNLRDFFFNLFQEKLPEPFPIPLFRKSTEDNLAKKLLLDGDRKYIVQTLATVLMTHKQRPSLSDCGAVAKSLVKKFSFLSDFEGDGEVCKKCVSNT